MSDSEYDEWGEGVMLTVMKMVVKMVDDYNSVILLTLFGPGGHTVYFWPKKMGSMRRILGTISVAISHFLQNKSDSYNRSVCSTALSLF